MHLELMESYQALQVIFVHLERHERLRARY
jgi:hypothetical protein